MKGNQKPEKRMRSKFYLWIFLMIPNESKHVAKHSPIY